MSPSLKYEDERRSPEILQRSNSKFDVLGFTEIWADKMRDHFASELKGGNLYKSYIPQADVNFFKRTFAGSPGMVLSVKVEWECRMGIRTKIRLLSRHDRSAIADLVGWVEVTKPNITFSSLLINLLGFTLFNPTYILFHPP